MPSRESREYYRMGYQDGLRDARRDIGKDFGEAGTYDFYNPTTRKIQTPTKRKRKLSAWNKFVKANSKKPRFIMRSGKLNLKKLGVAFRKTPAGRKRKR
jgi:hypothetical protein